MQTDTASESSIDSVIDGFSSRLVRIEYFAAWRDDVAAVAERIAGARTSDALAERRGFACCDWAVRTIAPAAYDLWARVTEDAADAARARAWTERMRALPPLEDDERARTAARTVQGALADARTASSAPPIDGSIGEDPMWGLNSPGWQAAQAAAFVARNASNACYFTSSKLRAGYAAETVYGAASAAYALIADRLVDDWGAGSILSSEASRPIVEPWWRRLWDESLAQLTRLIDLSETGGSAHP